MFYHFYNNFESMIECLYLTYAVKTTICVKFKKIIVLTYDYLRQICNFLILCSDRVACKMWDADKYNVFGN